MGESRQPISFIATSHPEQALGFYRDVMGLDLLEDSAFALVFSDAGHMLRVQKVGEHTPPQHTVHGWQVTDITREMEGLAARGVHFRHFDRLDQSAEGVWTTPDGHKVAWFCDPSGNTLSLTQFV